MHKPVLFVHVVSRIIMHKIRSFVHGTHARTLINNFSEPIMGNIMFLVATNPTLPVSLYSIDKNEL